MMFDVGQDRKAPSDLLIIANNYTVLHYDEFPMLFCGTNKYGNSIVGSLMCEDEENDIFRYLYLIVTPHDYVSYIKNKISYRELINKQENAYLIDKNFEEEVLTSYYVAPSEIPDSFLPHPKLFCPNAEVAIGTDFTISLKGKIADLHEAISDRVTIVSKGINQLFENIIGAVNNISNVHSEVRQLAHSPTSFGLNFRIKFNINSNHLFANNASQEIALNEFVASALNYSINHLPTEAKQLAENKIENTQFQKLVEEPLKKAYGITFQQYDDKAKEKLLKSTLKIPFDLEKITDQLGMGFDYLEVNSYSKNNEKSTIGLMDRAFSDSLDIAKDDIDLVKEDVRFKENVKLEIHVYHLNTETRKGNAHITYMKDGKKIQDSPKIQFTGNASLSGSDYIESMDKGTYIPVNVAKAKTVDGRYKNLIIEF